jgi:proteinaceous RNase P
VTIDIDPRETEMFAESLFTLACQREAKNNEFRKFQACLDRHGPFDAIVDAANVGLYNQNFGDGGFNFFQVNLCLPYFHACSLLQFKIIEDYEA